MILEPGGAVLAPDERLVLGVLGGVGAHVGEHGVGPVGRWGADAEGQGHLALASGKGYHLVHVAGDHLELVQDRQRRVEPFQPLRDGRQHLK